MNNKAKHYEDARQCMIESQIHPMGVVSEALLKAFSIVPREEFVPENQKGICYCDEDLEVSNGRFLMEPSVLARLIQAADLQPDDVVLSVGTTMGYNAAILSQLVTTVVAIEEDNTLMASAQAAWDKLSYCNIASVSSPLYNGAAEHAPYDVILINGAVAEISDDIKSQLKVGGRLVTVIKKPQQTMGKAIIIEHIEQDMFSSRVLFDAGTPYLKGFEPKKEFVF